MTEKKAAKVQMKGDTLSVEMELPIELAEEILRIQEEDPDLLARMFQYALTRRMVYQHLKSEDERQDRPVTRETGFHGSLSAREERLAAEDSGDE